MLWLDATHVSSDSHFKMYFPTVKDMWGNIQRVGMVLAGGETQEVCVWITQQLQHMSPQVSVPMALLQIKTVMNKLIPFMPVLH